MGIENFSKRKLPTVSIGIPENGWPIHSRQLTSSIADLKEFVKIAFQCSDTMNITKEQSFLFRYFANAQYGVVLEIFGGIGYINPKTKGLIFVF